MQNNKSKLFSIKWTENLKYLFDNPIIVDSYKHIAKREKIYDR